LGLGRSLTPILYILHNLHNAGDYTGNGGYDANDCQNVHSDFLFLRLALYMHDTHQMWRVEICPWRMDFSQANWAEAALRGKETLMRQRS
jgi:hypothetical protein